MTAVNLNVTTLPVMVVARRQRAGIRRLSGYPGGDGAHASRHRRAGNGETGAGPEPALGPEAPPALSREYCGWLAVA